MIYQALKLGYYVLLSAGIKNPVVDVVRGHRLVASVMEGTTRDNVLSTEIPCPEVVYNDLRSSEPEDKELCKCIDAFVAEYVPFYDGAYAGGRV